MTDLQSITINTDCDFDLISTLFSGQSFMWNHLPFPDNTYASVIDNTAVLLQQLSPDQIIIKCGISKLYGFDLIDFIRHYFSLDVDHQRLFPEQFRRRYPDLWKQLIPHMNLRVMRQDPFEIMVTFMCAQGIGMHLIRRQVSMIAERFGKEIPVETVAGTLQLHSFPAPSALASADPDELARCTNNNRIRAANIIAMSRAFESGSMALACVESGNCPLDTLRDTLQLQRGIGMKIADCIALFGLGRFDSFPIDTHVKQYLWEWFGIDAARRSLTEKNYRYLQEEAKNILGEQYAGYAGHILFHCWRREVRKMKSY
jgi:N-glycosylase/DNA lyase